MQPDANDLVYNQYSIDWAGFLQYLLRNVLHLDQVTISGILHTLGVIWDVYALLAFLVSGLLIFGIIYAYLREEEYSEMATEAIEHAEKTWRELYGTESERHNQRWRDVEMHVASEQPNDWKLAIIEADIMLGDGLKEKGFAGLSIGEQLKSMSPSQFPSLQDAWDAHRIRNRIAHEGADFVLTQSLAREAIVKYERALRELGVL